KSAPSLEARQHCLVRCPTLPENVRVTLSCRHVPGVLCLLAATDQRLTEPVRSLLQVAGRLVAPPVAPALALKSTKALAPARAPQEKPAPGRGSPRPPPQKKMAPRKPPVSPGGERNPRP